MLSVLFDVHGNASVQTINAVDILGRTINGLSMGLYQGRLVIASKDIGVNASKQGDIFTWNANVVDGSGKPDTTNSYYIQFSNEITSVVPYGNGLLCFTDRDNTYIEGNPVEVSTYNKKGSNIGGCASYSSWIIHDKYLFFYDKYQRNIYQYQQNDFGQNLLGDPIATEIQTYFSGNFNRCKLYSAITDTRNEIWMIFNDNILVLDYFNKEWCERKEPTTINCISLYQDILMSGDNQGNLYVEHLNRDFNGTFIGSSYQTQLINYGSNSDLKKQKSPICITVDSSFNNNFWIELTVDNVKKEAKNINLNTGTNALWGDDTSDISDNCTWDVMTWANENLYEQKIITITMQPMWYSMKIRIFTQNPFEDFAIQSIELKRLKMKNKTLGR